MFLCLFPVSINGARRIALVDINLAGREKIMLIPEVTRKLAESIVNYRNEKGYFEVLEDLMKIPEMDENLFKEIVPYLTITPPKEIKADELYDEFDELQEKETTGDVDADIEKLEEYTAHPLDINTALFSQLIELPYITEKIAKKIIKYRNTHRGFSSLNELRKVVSDFIVDKIYPFVTVLREDEIEEFHGNMRFRYGVWPYPFIEKYFNADSIYHNPQYFYSRLRLYYGNKAEVGLVLRKDRNSLELNYENIRNYFLIKNYLLLRNVLSMDTVIIGNYSLNFAQGAFIQPEPFLIRRIPRKDRGLKEDKGTHYNDNFYGMAGVKRFGGWEVFCFYSNKPLIIDYLNYDGSVGTPPAKFYNYQSTYLDITSGGRKHYEFFGSLKEKLYGTRIKYSLFYSLSIGAGYYEEEFDPYIDPSVDGDDGNIYLLSDYYFRGDKVKLISLDAEYTYNNFKLFLDVARSHYHTFDRSVRKSDEYADTEPDWYWDYGDAYQVLAVFKYEKFKFWANYHWLDYDYFAFHSSPLVTGLGDEEFKRDEQGYILGGSYRYNNIKTQISFKYGKPIIPPRFYSTQINDLTTRAAKDVYEVYWDNSWKPLEKFTVKYRNTYIIKNRTYAYGEPSAIGDYLYGDDFHLHIPFRTYKNRIELIHEPSSDVRLKWRLETVDSAYKELGVNMNGYMSFGELKYKPTSCLTVFSRITYWDAPKGVSTGAMEYTWPNALIPFGYYSTYSATQKNFRWYIMPTLKFSKSSKLWLKYEFWPKTDGAAKNVFKIQYDCSW